MRDDEDILNEVSGKPVSLAFGGQLLSPSQWGKTRLQLTSKRVIQKTKFIVSETYAEMLLTDVRGAAFVTQGNPVFLVLGIPLIAALGLGLILIILYFIFKHRFLIIHGTAFTCHVCVTGNPDKYQDFMDDVLAQAEKANAKAAGGGGGGRISETAASIPPARSTAPARSPAYTADNAPVRSNSNVVSCPSCGMEFQVPPGSAGKRFRCTQCKGIIEAPA